MNIIVNDNTKEFLSWLEKCRYGLKTYMETEYPNNPKDELVVSVGTKFIRINKVSEAKDTTTGRPISNSAWAFIDRTTGDILKPATYKAPAKGARGNIFDESNGTKSMGPYGPAYLRGADMGTFEQFGIVYPTL